MSHVVTFYSYKGGVGRTFILANVAVLLARRGLRVLIMDWDLEAPGLDRFFNAHLPSRLPTGKGVLPMLCDASVNLEASWKAHVVSVRNLKQGASLSLIPSGAATPEYARMLHDFSWRDFFEGGTGGPVLERWRNEWRRDFDFILVDSRTGLSDIGGVCTILLPDVLAVVFTASHQSVSGVRAVIDSAQQERQKLKVRRLPLAVLPIPSRHDGREEVDLGEKWLDIFAETFGPVMQAWLPTPVSPRDMLVEVKVPYVSRFSFGEELAVESYGTTNKDYPGYYMDRVTELLATSFESARKLVPHSVAPSFESGRKFIPHAVNIHFELVRSFVTDQVESFGFFVFSLTQASVLVGLGILAGYVLPRAHTFAAKKLPEDLLADWDKTHPADMVDHLQPTFIYCALALLAIGEIVVIGRALRTLVTFLHRKQPPPTDGYIWQDLRQFAVYCLGSAVALSALLLSSMAINAITALPLAWLLLHSKNGALIAGWILTAFEGLMVLLGLLFGFTQSVRGAMRLFREGTSGSVLWQSGQLESTRQTKRPNHREAASGRFRD